MKFKLLNSSKIDRVSTKTQRNREWGLLEEQEQLLQFLANSFANCL